MLCMKLIKGFPPNIKEIESVLGTIGETVYCWGDTLYAPDLAIGKELQEDVYIHERVHQKQQESYATPGMWWAKYLYDLEFRKEQEIGAFRAQFLWVKVRTTNKIAKECLFDLADILRSPLYGLQLSHQEAEQAIRKN